MQRGGILDDGERGGFDGWLGELRGGCGFGFGGVFDLAGAAWRGDVRVGFGDGGPSLLANLADELGGAADDMQSAGVGGGELEAVEERVGVLAVDTAGGKRVNDSGDRQLCGLAVLDGWELEDEGMIHHFGGLEIGLVAIEVVAAVEAIVEVAED